MGTFIGLISAAIFIVLIGLVIAAGNGPILIALP